MKQNKNQIQVGIAILLASLFFASLLVSPLNYVFLGIFLIATVLALLRAYDLKKVAMLLSPLIVFPSIIITVDSLLSSIKILDRVITGVRIYYTIPRWLFVFVPSLLFSVLYAYLFRDVLKKWIDPARRALLLALISVMVGVGLASSSFVRYCETVKRSEKGVLMQEIQACQTFGLYYRYFETSSNQSKPGVLFTTFFGSADILQGYIFVPIFMLFAGIGLQYATRKKELA